MIHPIRNAFTLLAASLVLSASTLRAQALVDYSDNEVDATNYDTTAPNDPTTLQVLAGTAIQSGVLSGSGGVIKTGPGSLSLTGANTYSGGTILNAGALRFDAVDSIGAGTLTINGGTIGTIAVDDAVFLHNDLVVNSDFTIDVPGVSGVLEMHGDVALGAGTSRTITLTSAGLSCFGGVISGHDLTFLSTVPSTQAMVCSDTSNTFTGTLRVGSGVSLELDKDSDCIAVSGNLQVDADAEVVLDLGNQFASTSDVEVNGTLVARSSNTNSIDALTGTGTIIAQTNIVDTLEVNSGTFAGSLTEEENSQLALTKKGSGTLTLTGTSDYAGGTEVQGGILAVNGSNAVTTTTVQTGGTLRGTGTVGAVSVASGGKLSGAAGGVLKVAGNLTLNTGSVTDVELDGTTRGTGYGAFDITGTGRIVTLGGTLIVRFDAAPSGADLTLYNLFDYGSNSPTLANFDAVKLYYGEDFQSDFLRTGRIWTTTAGPSTFTFDETTGSVSAVPEPTQWGMILAAGLFVLAVLRRRGRA